MTLANDSFNYVYPEFTSVIQEDLVGGYPTNTTLTVPNVDGEDQLFNLAVLYGGTCTQYQKVFIVNNGDEEALNVEVYGYNRNANSVMSMALEVGQDQQIIYGGQEKIKTNVTEPHLYDHYTFQEISGATPLSIPNVPIGEAVGIWLKLEFSSIDAFADKDEFMLGINFEGIAGTPLNLEQIIGHSRSAGVVSIRKIVLSKSVFRGWDIEYNWLDTNPLGVPENEAIYAVYVDRIKRIENSGVSRVSLQMYGNGVPVDVEIFLLPYSGFVPDLSGVPTNSNRVKIVWNSRNPNLFDVVRHTVYWDEATGIFKTKPILEAEAKDAYGGGDKVETLKLLN